MISILIVTPSFLSGKIYDNPTLKIEMGQAQRLRDEYIKNLSVAEIPTYLLENKQSISQAMLRPKRS